MKKIIFTLLFAFASLLPTYGQSSTTTAGRITASSATLSGACSPNNAIRVDASFTVKVCLNGTWQAQAIGQTVSTSSSVQFNKLGLGTAVTQDIVLYDTRSLDLAAATGNQDWYTNYTYTGAAYGGSWFGKRFTSTVNGTGTWTGTVNSATYEMVALGTGTYPSLRGQYVSAYSNAGGATVTDLAGMWARYGQGAGTVQNAYGIYLDPFGTCNNIYGVYFNGNGTGTKYPLYSLGGTLYNKTGATGTIGQVVQAASGQTANLVEWQNNSAALMSGIDATGRLRYSTGLTASTVGAAGGATALPATPTGYLLVNVNGTQMKVPYYAN